MTAELVVLRGPSASGKSTVARKFVTGHGYHRVNKDCLRTMLHYDEWNKWNEKATVLAQESVVNSLLIMGRKVLVDNTHLLTKDREQWQHMADRHDFLGKQGHGVLPRCEVIFIDLFDVPFEVCVERDATRTGIAHVGDEVIRRQFKQMRELINAEAKE